MQPILTPEIEAVLRRYMEIQQEERRVQEEKRSLQLALFEYLKDAPGREWHVTVADRRVKVTHDESTRVTYDEKALAARLGARYLEILAVDPKKLREQERLVEPYLRPVLLQIGSPDRDKIRKGIEAGLFSSEDFKGAFVKTVKPFIAVSVAEAGRLAQTAPQ